MQLTSRVPAVQCETGFTELHCGEREKLHNPVWSISSAYRRQAGTGEPDTADSGEIPTDSGEISTGSRQRGDIDRQHIDSRQQIADSR